MDGNRADRSAPVLPVMPCLSCLNASGSLEARLPRLSKRRPLSEARSDTTRIRIPCKPGLRDRESEWSPFGLNADPSADSTSVQARLTL